MRSSSFLLALVLGGCANILDLGGRTDLDQGNAPGLQGEGVSGLHVVAVGEGGTIAVRDPSGAWALATVSGGASDAAPFFLHVAANGGHFVALDSKGSPFVSHDARSFKAVPLSAPCKSFGDLAVHGGAFYVLTGDWSIGACALRSTDGETWETLPSPDSYMFVDAASFGGELWVSARYKSDLMWPALYRFRDGTFEVSAKEESSSGASKYLGRATTIVGQPYTVWEDHTITRVESASPWTTTDLPKAGLEDMFVSGITGRGGRLVVVGRSLVDQGEVGMVATHTIGGAAWTARKGTRELHAAVDTGDVIVAVGDDGTIEESTDGTSWTPKPSPATRTLRAVAASR